MPEEDLNALLNPPNYLDQIEDGAFEDQISDQLQIDFDSALNDRYQQALVSTKIIEQLDGQLVRIPDLLFLWSLTKRALLSFFWFPTSALVSIHRRHHQIKLFMCMPQMVYNLTLCMILFGFLGLSIQHWWKTIWQQRVQPKNGFL